MTSNVEMLPLPEPSIAHDALGGLHTPKEVLAYARACVAHATAAKDAEIARLQSAYEAMTRQAQHHMEQQDKAEADTEALREQLDWVVKQNDMLLDEGRELTERAERLAEALRYAEAALADIGDADREPGDDVAWCERRAALGLRVVRDTLRDAALHPTAAQENGDE